MRSLVAIVLVAAAALAWSCNREDGEPDPPVQMLVPCDPSAPADDPSACPPEDASLNSDGGISD